MRDEPSAVERTAPDLPEWLSEGASAGRPVNTVERLIADNLFGRLRALRDELQARLDDEDRDRQMAVEYALDELDAIVGEA